MGQEGEIKKVKNKNGDGSRVRSPYRRWVISICVATAYGLIFFVVLAGYRCSEKGYEVSSIICEISCNHHGFGSDVRPQHGIEG
jgi:hypothetical protein